MDSLTQISIGIFGFNDSYIIKSREFHGKKYTPTHIQEIIASLGMNDEDSKKN